VASDDAGCVDADAEWSKTEPEQRLLPATATQSSELDKLIAACYNLSGKPTPVKTSDKTKAIGQGLLNEHGIEWLLAATAFAAKHPAWKKQFVGAKWPVNYLASSSVLPNILSKLSSPSIKRPAPGPAPAQPAICPRCQGNGTTFSQILGAELPCSCQP